MATVEARRVTIYKGADGWRYIVQSRNWKVIDKAEQGFSRKSTVLGRIAKRFPDVEVVERLEPEQYGTARSRR